MQNFAVQRIRKKMSELEDRIIAKQNSISIKMLSSSFCKIGLYFFFLVSK